jgi:hypothetical protein
LQATLDQVAEDRSPGFGAFSAKAIVEKITAVSATGCEESEESDFVILLFTAWSPIRRTNVG